MERCSLKFYKMGEEVGNGKFAVDGTLNVTVDADVISDGSAEETVEPVSKEITEE